MSLRFAMSDTGDPQNEEQVHQLLTTHYHSEVYTHRLLWIFTEREAELADAKEEGSLYHNLVALVFASLTVEGYVNYAGERLDHQVWQNDRNYFSKPPYHGVTGKLKKVTELVALAWEPEKEPLKSILELKDLRDLIAHSKPQKSEGTVEHSVQSEYPHLTGDILSKRISKSARIDGMTAVERFVEQLQAAARKKLPYDIYFYGEALRGPISEGGWVTGPKE
jgi:hypothetical protein